MPDVFLVVALFFAAPPAVVPDAFFEADAFLAAPPEAVVFLAAGFRAAGFFGAGASGASWREPAKRAAQPTSRACGRGSFASRIARSRHVLDGPLEVVRRERVDVHVRRRVHEVDGVGHAVADGPLHRVHVVAQRSNEFPRVVHDALAELRAQVLVFDVVAPLARVVLDRQDVVLAEAEAADELVPLDKLLEHHREQPRVVVVVDQLLLRLAHVDLLPAAAVGVLQHAREADVLHDPVPVERVRQVPQATPRGPPRAT